MVAGFQIRGVFDGRVAVAAEDYRDFGDAADGWGWIRLPAGLVSRWKIHCVHFVPERCAGAVAAGCEERRGEAVDERWRGECGTAVVSGWEETCFCFDGL